MKFNKKLLSASAAAMLGLSLVAPVSGAQVVEGTEITQYWQPAPEGATESTPGVYPSADGTLYIDPNYGENPTVFDDELLPIIKEVPTCEPNETVRYHSSIHTGGDDDVNPEFENPEDKPWYFDSFVARGSGIDADGRNATFFNPHTVIYDAAENVEINYDFSREGAAPTEIEFYSISIAEEEQELAPGISNMFMSLDDLDKYLADGTGGGIELAEGITFTLFDDGKATLKIDSVDAIKDNFALEPNVPAYLSIIFSLTAYYEDGVPAVFPEDQYTFDGDFASGFAADIDLSECPTPEPEPAPSPTVTETVTATSESPAPTVTESTTVVEPGETVTETVSPEPEDNEEFVIPTETTVQPTPEMKPSGSASGSSDGIGRCFTDPSVAVFNPLYWLIPVGAIAGIASSVDIEALGASGNLEVFNNVNQLAGDLGLANLLPRANNPLAELTAQLPQVPNHFGGAPISPEQGGQLVGGFLILAGIAATAAYFNYCLNSEAETSSLS